jgi:hypothetical protein
MEKPQSIKVMVPTEFGTVYEGQWVERVIRVSRDDYKAIRQLEDAKVSWMRDDKLLAELSAILSHLFTDWNLEGEEGPLPKPWEEPKAFEALAASDLHLFLWLLRKSLASVAELAEPAKN